MFKGRAWLLAKQSSASHLLPVDMAASYKNLDAEDEKVEALR